jgi:hypothetical protein
VSINYWEYSPGGKYHLNFKEQRAEKFSQLVLP